jgi:predicted DCC family thiol-disulfide oxidoreductase YuxK
VRFLEAIDAGQQFQYSPMQDQQTLEYFGITSQDCELGMILIKSDLPKQRWQGSDAAEAIASLLPAGQPLIELYRTLTGIKWMGDRLYEQVRDHRYTLFGKRSTTYRSIYPICDSDKCLKLKSGN